jgi:UDP-N-acetylmuramoyl-L-alanyl-D-glutamate--2,6-diaminopimelate ligase
MNLYDLLENLEIIEDLNAKNENIEAVHYHSRKVVPNSLFVCIKGYATDGHLYLEDAVKKGALAAIVEDFNPSMMIPQFKVKNSRRALALLGHYFYNQPSKDIKTIGITATNGKTTTSFMINEILEAEGLDTGLMGTVVVKIKDSKEAASLTTPESLEVHHNFYKMKTAGVSHCTMEVSSSALELDRVLAVDFDVVALNNISREHIDQHGSFEAYYNFKASLIRNAKKDAFVILNLDDPYSKALIEETQGQVLTYGVSDQSGDVYISDLDLSSAKAYFKVHYKDTSLSYEIQLSIPGYHCVYNALVAITISKALNLSPETIKRGLENFQGIERRFECIYQDDFKIYDDHFANTGNIEVTMETLNFMTYEDCHLIYAIRGSRGVTVNKENAEVMAKWAKKIGLKEVIATRSIDFVTDKDKVTSEELQVFLEVMKSAEIKVVLKDTLEEAIDLGLTKIQAKDVMLLAGCQGMDYGAYVALNKLKEILPEEKHEALLKPLKYRVAGLPEGILNE